MMASGPPPIHFSPYPTPNCSQSPQRIPFEYSKIMDECRVEVLKKFKKDIIDQVKFSDVSAALIECGLVSKDECFELCKLPVKGQMAQCFQKIHDIMDILVCQLQKSASKKKLSESKSPGEIGESIVEEHNRNSGIGKNIWDNFLQALKKEHVPLANKLENELYKCAESKLLKKKNNNASGGGGSIKLRKEDIGKPTDFQHLQHYGLKKTPSRQDMPLQKDSNSNHISLEALDQNDPDLQEFFKRAGVLDRHLHNDAMKQIIVNFIAEHGGMDTIRKEVRQHEQSKKPMTIGVDKATQCQSDTGSISTTSSVTSNNKLDNNGVTNVTVFMQRENSLKNGKPVQGPPPATVPFEPTPKPTPNINLYYF